MANEHKGVGGRTGGATLPPCSAVSRQETTCAYNIRRCSRRYLTGVQLLFTVARQGAQQGDLVKAGNQQQASTVAHDRAAALAHLLRCVLSLIHDVTS
jgi:hypothetical protein